VARCELAESATTKHGLKQRAQYMSHIHLLTTGQQLNGKSTIHSSTRDGGIRSVKMVVYIDSIVSTFAAKWLQYLLGQWKDRCSTPGSAICLYWVYYRVSFLGGYRRFAQALFKLRQATNGEFRGTLRFVTGTCGGRRMGWLGRPMTLVSSIRPTLSTLPNKR